MCCWCPAVPSRALLGAAGLLDGVPGITHGSALTLAAMIAGPEVAQTIQLAIEYDPQPPFDAGSPSKAPTAIYDMAVAALGD